MSNNQKVKKAKYSHSDDDDSGTTISLKTQDEYLNRWSAYDDDLDDEKADRTITLDLLKQGGVAMYEWKHSLEKERTDESKLVGEYDVILVYGMGYGTDQGYICTDHPICRTVTPGAKLTLWHSEAETNDDHRSEEGNSSITMLGHILGVKKSETSFFRGDWGWEYIIQMDDVHFHADDSGDCFFVDTADGDERYQEECLEIFEITNDTVLERKPTEAISNDDYCEFMGRMSKSHQRWEYWKKEHSWLCNHKAIPMEAAKAIHSYNRHHMPNAEFELKKGDIVLEMDSMCTYATSWNTTYVARPRNN